MRVERITPGVIKRTILHSHVKRDRYESISPVQVVWCTSRVSSFKIVDTDCFVGRPSPLLAFWLATFVPLVIGDCRYEFMDSGTHGQTILPPSNKSTWEIEMIHRQHSLSFSPVDIAWITLGKSDPPNWSEGSDTLFGHHRGTPQQPIVSIRIGHYRISLRTDRPAINNTIYAIQRQIYIDRIYLYPSQPMGIRPPCLW